MTRLGIILLALVAAALSALVATHRADAISREGDIVRDLNETFKAPSVFPPNPALRPNFDAARTYGRPGDRGDEHVLAPFAPDQGPPEEHAPDIVPDRAFPFLVAIVNGRRPPQEGYRCAGTLIAPGWVVTAAHCTFSWVRRWPVDPEPAVMFNTTRLSQPGPRVAVRKIIPHPDYNARTLQSDIALLRIDTGGEQFGPPLRLEGPPPQELEGEIAHIVGWGVTNLSLLQREKGEAQQLLQVMVRGPACFGSGNFPKLKGMGVFCATSLYRHHDTCYRFGGGPIILRDHEGKRYLAGMVSWPAACPPEMEKMNAYLDIQYFVPWIKSTIAANGGPAQ